MTAQFTEKFIIEGECHSMCAHPLNNFRDLGGVLPKLTINCTSLWRGYVGTWELMNDRLYLTKLQGVLADGKEFTLDTVFPNCSEKVFAHWYSGTARSPRGKLLKYVHMNYGSTYEFDFFYEFEKGILINTTRIANEAQGCN